MALSTVSSVTSALINNILTDSIFVAEQMALMPMLVTQYNSTGMAARKMGIYPQATAQEVAEGVDYANATELTKTTTMTLTPKKAKVQFILTDERVETDPEDARADAARVMGDALARKIDKDHLELFASFTNGKGTANTTLTIANCAAAVAVLRNNNAPNPLFGVLHAYQWQDIWAQLGSPSANQAFLGNVANQALEGWFVNNSFLNINWYIDANIVADSNDDAIGAVFHREALALDTRKAPSLEPERDASRDAWELNLSTWYAVGIRRNSFGVKITSDVTEPT